MGIVGSGLSGELKGTKVSAIVPGVATLFGEFSFYCRGSVLCCTNNRYLKITASASPDSLVHIVNSLTNDHRKFPLTSLKFRKEDKWANYIKGMYLQLAEMGNTPPPLDFVLEGPVLKDDNSVLAPAVCTGVLLILRRIMGLELDDDRMSMMCYMCCTSFCGELTKYSTVTAMLRAREGYFILCDLDSLKSRMLENPFGNGPCSLLAIDCKTPPLAMREEIRNTHIKVRDSFLRLHAAVPNRSLKDFPLADLRERVLPLDEECRKTCNAVLEDSNAALSMSRCFTGGQFQLVGKTLAKTGKLIRDDLELSCPEIDWLIKRASEVPLCHGAGIIFNGDNTYAAVVIDDQAMPRYLEKLDDYERIFGFKPRINPLEPQGCAKLE